MEIRKNFKRTILLLCMAGILAGCARDSQLSEVKKQRESRQKEGSEQEHQHSEEKQEKKQVETPEEKQERKQVETSEEKQEKKQTETFLGNVRKNVADMKLHVAGNKIVNEREEAVVLQGVSTHGLHWFPQYVNRETFAEFQKNWNCNTIRLAMYPGEGGYSTGANQQWLKELIGQGVAYGKELGMYVIIDWHSLNDDRDPNTFKEDALLFWDEMSRQYSGCEHVIYEICNEPNSTSWSQVKSYAEDVIKVIRANDPESIIIVGTPQWCQLPVEAAKSPLEQNENVVYSVHFYAASHREEIRNNLIEAYHMGLPIIVSEYSICDASGNGGIDYESAHDWLQLLDQYEIGRVAWNISNKAESSALLRSDKLSGWQQEELSESGKWIKNQYCE